MKKAVKSSVKKVTKSKTVKKAAAKKTIKKVAVKASSKKTLKSKTEAFKKKVQLNLNKYKKIVEAKVGKIDWVELSKAAFLLLIAAGLFGVFGPKAQLAAKFIWPVYAGAAV